MLINGIALKFSHNFSLYLTKLIASSYKHLSLYSTEIVNKTLRERRVKHNFLCSSVDRDRSGSITAVELGQALSNGKF